MVMVINAISKRRHLLLKFKMQDNSFYYGNKEANDAIFLSRDGSLKQKKKL